MMNSVPFYSHSKNESGIRVGSKLLSDHINNMKLIASSAKCFDHNIIDKKEQKELVTNLVRFHDLGKYTSYFQNYLLGKPGDGLLKNHSKIGAYSIYQFYKKIAPKIAPIAYYIVKSHHSNLINFIDDPLFSNNEKIYLENQFNYQRKDLQTKCDIIKEELKLPEIDEILVIPGKNLRRELKALSRLADISNYFLINYLFSILIESDKLDASGSPVYQYKNIESALVKNHIVNFKKDFLKDYVRSVVVSQIDKTGFSYEGKIYTLTAPTGIGKTLTALEFALKIREKEFTKTGIIKKIIYALPFINIIEQAIQVYSQVIGNNGKVFAQYQYSDLGEDDSDYNIRKMLMETWQADIIITTFVQLLETIISNKNKSLKKFHHFQNSILILDEVQAVNLQHLPLVGAMLFYLSKYLNTTILLMTATKPLIFELANSVLLKNEKSEYRELLPNYPEIFKKFNRTKIVPLFEDEPIGEEQLLSLVKENYNNKKSVLIVCNKIDTSLNFFHLIKKEFAELGYKTLYLSTNLIHSHRLYVINRVKELTQKGEKLILVSTQSIEAGVDLSFEIGFRDLAPLDSIIQAAGRVNRNNDPINFNAPVYIFNTGDCKKIYGTMTESIVSDLLSKTEAEILEQDYLELIEKYFEEISGRKSFDESIEYFDALKKIEYTSRTNAKAISDFRVIENDDFKISIFIEIDKTASNTLRIFKDYLNNSASKQLFESVKSDFHRRIVQVPLRYKSHFTENEKLTDGIYVVTEDVIEQYYDDETGFIRSAQDQNNNNLISII